MLSASWAVSTRSWLMPSFHPREYPSPLLWGWSQWLLPICAYIWDCSEPGAALCIWTCWISGSSHGPLLESVQVPIEVILSFFGVICTAQLQVICKHDEGALDLTFCVTDEDVEEHWPQDRALRDTADCCPPPRHKAIDHNSLAAFIEPIPYPLDAPPIKSMSLQLGDKEIMWDHTKGLTED